MRADCRCSSGCRADAAALDCELDCVLLSSLNVRTPLAALRADCACDRQLLAGTRTLLARSDRWIADADEWRFIFEVRTGASMKAGAGRPIRCADLRAAIISALRTSALSSFASSRASTGLFRSRLELHTVHCDTYSLVTSTNTSSVDANGAPQTQNSYTTKTKIAVDMTITMSRATTTPTIAGIPKMSRTHRS